MKFNWKLVFSLIVSIGLNINGANAEKKVKISNSNTTVILSKHPAENWHECTPLGNGRLGAMVYGGVNDERIKINESSFWSGEPRNLQNPEAAQYLPEIRKLLNQGDNVKAEEIINSKLLGPNNECYLPMADIMMNFGSRGKFSNYKRKLDLSKALLTVEYDQNGDHFKRELFVSYPSQAIIMRIKCSKSKSINCSFGLESLVHFETHAEKNQLIINGQAPIHAYPSYEGKKEPVYIAGEGMRFQGKLLIQSTNGRITSTAKTLAITNASEMTIVFTAATSFNGFDKKPFTQGKDEKKTCSGYLSGVRTKSFSQLLNEHINDYSSLFGRVEIDLGRSEYSNLPIEERIKNYKPDNDPGLTGLYFQFGRYLLISSSRPGSQPANLQGIWSDNLQPAWSANWTLNCNAEINYWPAECTNLSECHMPFLQLIRETTVDGSKTASNLYHSKGWMAHHNLDIWRTTWPVGGSGKWAMFQIGGAWLCEHIWEHYLFTQNSVFLRSNYFILKQASLFFIDNLQKDENGFYLTNPSVSFENEYLKPNGEIGWATRGSTEDIEAIHSLFEHVLLAASIVHDKDTSFLFQIKDKLAHLIPLKISPRTNQLQEWQEDVYPASAANGQVPQGWALMPGNSISLKSTPQLAAALRKTIEVRKLTEANNSGSWIGAFAANYWARLQEGDSVKKVIDRHFSKALYPNLTCKFSDEFQIDGNLGITTAIAQMLVQSQDGDIHLLPALPSTYKTGFIKGMKAQGNYEVAVYWQKGRLEKAIIHSLKSGVCAIRYKNIERKLTLKKGATIFLNQDLQTISYIDVSSKASLP
ncbi:glycoside hydrolase family 95 protein [Mucilaginibacter sp. SJ]|uniref:glycoside hydrolase family 95 protein n=1 Tax=Mucilaginibacter sp. SJ TaxID=3029053 RepID=UPI0023A97767|nr:glycoside hydrolase family 95 protein [Mucilaginibacter sp. SJ]WEA00638.1 glycoside hydrolase family 95 protein [Mucilaginibacter sp. SJ]